MSKIYNKSDIEIRAKQLLSPIQMACPDNVWHELSCQLNEQGARKRTASNKLFSSKNLVVAITVLGVIIFGVWELSIQLEGKAVYRPVKTAVSGRTETYTKSVKKDVAGDNKPSQALLASGDSVKPVNNTVKPAPNLNPTSLAKPSLQTRTPQFVVVQPAKKQDNLLVASGTKINSKAMAIPQHSATSGSANSANATPSAADLIKAKDTTSVLPVLQKVVRDSAIDDAASPADGHDTINSN